MFAFFICVVRQLHRDFAHAGCDVLQAFTFYATDSKLAITEDQKCYTVSGKCDS